MQLITPKKGINIIKGDDLLLLCFVFAYISPLKRILLKVKNTTTKIHATKELLYSGLKWDWNHHPN